MDEDKLFVEQQISTVGETPTALEPQSFRHPNR